MDIPRPIRFAEFLDRLRRLPTASSFDLAYTQITETMNVVEDELTNVEFAPERWPFEDRMYPPHLDSLEDLPALPRVRRFRSRSHFTFVGDKGAIAIQRTSSGLLPADDPVFVKAGADGQSVADLTPSR